MKTYPRMVTKMWFFIMLRSTDPFQCLQFGGLAAKEFSLCVCLLGSERISQACLPACCRLFLGKISNFISNFLFVCVRAHVHTKGHSFSSEEEGLLSESDWGNQIVKYISKTKQWIETFLQNTRNNTWWAPLGRHSMGCSTGPKPWVPMLSTCWGWAEFRHCLWASRYALRV